MWIPHWSDTNNQSVLRSPEDQIAYMKARHLASVLGLLNNFFRDHSTDRLRELLDTRWVQAYRVLNWHPLTQIIGPNIQDVNKSNEDILTQLSGLAQLLRWENIWLDGVPITISTAAYPKLYLRTTRFRRTELFIVGPRKNSAVKRMFHDLRGAPVEFTEAPRP